MRIDRVFALDECERFALEAIQLNDQLAEAHAALGVVLIEEWDWEGSEAAFKRAIDLNPNSVMAHQWYHALLRPLMRYDQALLEIKRAEELDPLNLLVKTMVGWPLMDQQRYREALAQWDEVLEMEPEYGLAHYNKGLVYINLGMPEEVLKSARRAAQWMGEDHPAADMLTASGYALRGEEDRALAILAEVERNYGSVMDTWIAAVYLTLGQEEAALTRLENAYDNHSSELPNDTSERTFDSLRDHPRFQALRRKLELP